MITEVEGRAAILAEARSWLGTPYHGNAAIKGAGVDCIRFIQRCYVDAGVIAPFIIPQHPMQWALHQKLELLLEGILTYAREVEEPLPADVSLFKIGRCWGHSAIILDWPTVIHANPPGSCRYANVNQETEFMTSMRKIPARFFSVWAR